jgi:hypothetical protein
MLRQAVRKGLAFYPTSYAGATAASVHQRTVERQTVALQTDGGASGWFGRAVPFRTSELVAAPFAAPPLLACDEAEPDETTTAAPGTVRKIGDYQNVIL